MYLHYVFSKINDISICFFKYKQLKIWCRYVAYKFIFFLLQKNIKQSMTSAYFVMFNSMIIIKHLT